MLWIILGTFNIELSNLHIAKTKRYSLQLCFCKYCRFCWRVLRTCNIWCLSWFGSVEPFIVVWTDVLTHWLTCYYFTHYLPNTWCQFVASTWNLQTEFNKIHSHLLLWSFLFLCFLYYLFISFLTLSSCLFLLFFKQIFLYVPVHLYVCCLFRPKNFFSQNPIKKV